MVEEGLLTNTQKQTEFMQLTTLSQMGMPIPDSLIIEKSSLHCRPELTEILDAQAKQEQEMVQRQMQMQDQQMQVTTEGIEAKAQSDQALAAERLNKIHLDEAISAERKQRSEEESTASLLNMAKLLKELEGMDMQGLMGKLEMLKGLNDIEHSHHEREMAQHDVNLRHRELDINERQMQQQAIQPQVP